MFSMFSILLSVYAVSLVAAHPPASTTRNYNPENGWSPRPTTAPRLSPRQLSDDSVCGYVSGIESSSITCPGLRSCFFNTRLSAAGCCLFASDTPAQCGQFTSCVPRSETAQCTGACARDPLVAVCTDILAPECFTYAFPGFKNIGCGISAGLESARFTFLGQDTTIDISTRIQTAEATATEDEEKPTFTFGFNRPSSTSGSSVSGDDDDSTTSLGGSGRRGRKSGSSGGRKGKKSGSGGIIGGAAAGLIIISIIVSLITWYIKKRKNDKQQQPVYQQQQQYPAASQVPLQQYQAPTPQYPTPTHTPGPVYYEQPPAPMKTEYSGQAQQYYQQPHGGYPGHN